MEDLQLDSDDEKYIGWYFQELKEAGIIIDFNRSKSYELNKPLKDFYIEVKVLITKTKDIKKEQTLIPIKVYTPDFDVFWDYKLSEKFQQSIVDIGNRKLTKCFITQGNLSVVEVKPIFDQNNMTRLFKTNQAIIWDKYGIYVNLITYQELFEATFTPLKYIIEEGTYKKNSKHGNKGDNKIKWKVKTLQEYLEC